MSSKEIEVLIELVEENTSKSKRGSKITKWKNVLKEMKKLFPDETMTYEKVRQTYLRLKNDSKRVFEKDVPTSLYRKGFITREDQLLKTIGNKKHIMHLEKILGFSDDEILGLCEKLRLKGYNIKTWKEDDLIWIVNEKELKADFEKVVNHESDDEEIIIALVSDTHIGSETSAIEELSEFYEYAVNQGVSTFYHCGDITDGFYTNRADSIYEQDYIGFQEQLNAVVDLYPKIEGYETHFITGNHDKTHVRNGGANIGEVLSKYRDDLVYHGHNFAKFKLSKKIELSIIHPTDGSTYAISHKLQKQIDGAGEEKLANIMALGHYHKVSFTPYKGVYGLMMPSFQRQSSFMKDLNLKSYVGGVILRIKQNQYGEIFSINYEFVSYD